MALPLHNKGREDEGEAKGIRSRKCRAWLYRAPPLHSLTHSTTPMQATTRQPHREQAHIKIFEPTHNILYSSPKILEPIHGAIHAQTINHSQIAAYDRPNSKSKPLKPIPNPSIYFVVIHSMPKLSKFKYSHTNPSLL